MNALLTYRRLTEADVPTFVTMRITQLKEEGAQSDLDLEPALTAYYQKHLADGTFVSWLAVDGEKHEPRLSQTRHCPKTAGSCGGRSQNLWLRSRVDHCV